MNAGAVFVCATCGDTASEWTAFCVKCGARRVIDAPPGWGLAQPAAPVQEVVAQPQAPVAQQFAQQPQYAQQPFRQQAGPAIGQPNPLQIPQQFAPAQQAQAQQAQAQLALPPAFAGLLPASTGRRLGAFTLDALLVAAVSTAVWFAFGSVVLSALAAVEVAVGLVVWEANRGKTVGNALLRLRTTRVEEPRNVGPARASLRAFVVAVGFLVAAVGAWVVVASSAFSGARKQGWHDLAGRTVTVVVPAGKRTPVQAARAAVERRPAPAKAHVGSRAAAAASVAIPSVAPPLAPQAPAAPVQAVSPPPVFVQPAAVSLRQDLPPELPLETMQVSYASPQVSSSRAIIVEADDDLNSDSGVAPPPLAPAVAVPVVGITERVLLFTFDTGQRERITVPGTGVMGRNPREFTQGDQLIVIDDPAKSVSKSHLLFRHTGTSLQVLDHGSTNGSEVLFDEGTSAVLAASQWTDVPAGSRVRVGDRVFAMNDVEAD